MKGLINACLIIIALIGIGIITSIFIYNALNNRVTVAHESGFEEGYIQGYEMGLQEGSIVGYQEGSQIAYGNAGGEAYDSRSGAGFYFLYNPTYDELQEVLAGSEQSYARELHDYVEANGIRAAYVRCPIAHEAAEGRVYIYELVACETVDRGLVIIEPQSLRNVKIEVGRSYSELNGFPPREYDDTINKIKVVW